MPFGQELLTWDLGSSSSVGKPGPAVSLAFYGSSYFKAWGAFQVLLDGA
jgi:hypothetical protein